MVMRRCIVERTTIAPKETRLLADGPRTMAQTALTAAPTVGPWAAMDEPAAALAKAGGSP